MFQIQYTKTECQLRLSFVVYADFESVLVNQSECAPKKQRNTKKKSWTIKIKRHVICGASLYIKLSDNRFSDDLRYSVEKIQLNNFSMQ